MAEQVEARARAALGEGFCPDCLKPLSPRDGDTVFGFCESGCLGYWVDGDFGLQVTMASASGEWHSLKLRIDRCEVWKAGERVRIM